MTRAFLVNQGLFQLAWPACVIGAANGVFWTGLLVVGALVLWQLNRHNRHPLDLRMIGVCLGLGFVLDTAWIQLGLLEFAMPWPSSQFAPMWIMLLWVSVALVINHSMAAFKNRLWILAIAGGVGSPMSYFAGSRFGAVEWLAPAWQVILTTGLSWAIVLPLLFWLARDDRASRPAAPPEGMIVNETD
ncbi:DUF2878 family protein [Wenzhouxiangella limi]|uniref:DUF2878 domain-containing protein n=1 Tax=Wenzhouxiangella limi TaxID=2707351 RepID=A0A845V3Z6_9GAMM|nr:DUF2878 domain-containing protein [Wenzhouxiangella limi]